MALTCAVPSLAPVASPFVPAALLIDATPVLRTIGVATMAVSTAAVTDNDPVPATLPTVAVMVVVSTATPVARPAVLIVAAAVFDELQVAVAERSCVLPSA